MYRISSNNPFGKTFCLIQHLFLFTNHHAKYIDVFAVPHLLQRILSLQKTTVLKQLLFYIFLLLPFLGSAQFNVDHYLKEGLRNIHESQYHKAIQRFTTITSVKQEMWEAFFLRGAAKFYLGDYHGAITDFNKGLDINPYFSELYLFRGISYQLLNDYATAKQNYVKAKELDPANPSVYVNLGLIETLGEKYDGGIKLFTRAIEIKPDYGDAYLYRALCYSEQKNSPRAFNDFENALRYNKFDERVYMWRGKLQFENEDYKAALRDYEKAISFNEENPLLYYYRALTRYEMNDLDGCLADFDKVISLNPANELVYYNRALVRTEVGLYDKALEDYGRVISLNPNNLLGHFNRGMLQLDSHNYSGAEHDFSKAIDIHSDFYWAYLGRAEALSAQGKGNAANADYLAAEDIKKQNGGNEFGDTARFKQLIKFDADFVEDSEGQMLALRGLMKTESKSLYATDFIFGLELAGGNTPYYFFPYIEQFNKHSSEKAKFAMLRHSDSLKNCVQNLPDSINASPEIKILSQGIHEALEENYNSASKRFDELLVHNSNYIPALFNRAYTKAAVVDMLRSFDEMQQEVSVISKSEELNKRSMPKQRKVYHDYYTVLQDYQKIINADPDFYFAYYNMGNVQAKMYNYHEAISQYSKALEINTEFAEAYYNRGLTHLYLTDTTAACADFSKAGQYGFSDVYTVIRKACGK